MTVLALASSFVSKLVRLALIGIIQSGLGPEPHDRTTGPTNEVLQATLQKESKSVMPQTGELLRNIPVSVPQHTFRAGYPGVKNSRSAFPATTQVRNKRHLKCCKDAGPANLANTDIVPLPVPHPLQGAPEFYVVRRNGRIQIETAAL